MPTQPTVSALRMPPTAGAGTFQDSHALIGLTLSGQSRVSFRHDGMAERSLTLGAGDIQITPPDMPHRVAWMPGSFALIRLPATFLPHEAQPRLAWRDAICEQLLRRVLHSATNPEAADALYLENLATMLGMQLMRASGHDGTARRRPLPPGIARVLERLADDPADAISLDAMAAMAGLSRFGFARAFKQATGRSPYAFVIERRIALAKRLLADPTLSLAEVAVRAGFSSQSHFTCHFRRITGVTPRAWRRMLG
jgi:AraC family transcriptional regulator